MTDGSEKRNRPLAFELQNSHVCEKHSITFKAVFNPLISFSVFLGCFQRLYVKPHQYEH